MKQRIILCILLAYALLYYALPRLPIEASNIGQLFSILWLLFAFVVIGGNLTHLLYSIERPLIKGTVKQRQKVRKIARSYYSSS